MKPNKFNEVKNGFYVPALMKRSWYAQIEVLKYVDSICRQNNLVYFADYGTLLGAVRHKGFIPWDDDIDIGMKRADYEKLKEILLKQPSEKFRIKCFQNSLEQINFNMLVISNYGASSDNRQMDEFHGFPFETAIDIFPYDYLPKSEEEKKKLIDEIAYSAQTLEMCEPDSKADSKDLSERIKRISETSGMQIDQSKDLKNQINQATEKIISRYVDSESEEIAIIPEWIKNHNIRLKKDIFENYIYIPFENIEIPAVCNYESILNTEFGEYVTPYLDNNGHGYPFFEREIQMILKEHPNSNVHRFSFNADSLKRMETHEKKTFDFQGSIDALESVSSFFLSLTNNSIINNSEELCDCIEKIQGITISVGNRIETGLLSNRNNIVKLVSECCELMYELYVSAENNTEAITEYVNEIRECLQKIKSEIINGKEEKKKRVAFIFERKEEFDYLKPLIESKAADEQNVIYAIPVPYYEYTDRMERGELCFEEELLSEDNIFDFRSFDFENEYFDELYYTNAYEEYDWGRFVAPLFFSGNLQRMSPKISFVQSYAVDDFDTDNMRMMYTFGEYVRTPGVIHADEILVQSERMKVDFEEILTEMSGEDMRMYWREKIKSINNIIEVQRDKQSDKNRCENRVFIYINTSQLFSLKTKKIKQVDSVIKELYGFKTDICYEEAIDKYLKDIDPATYDSFRKYLEQLTKQKDIRTIKPEEVDPQKYTAYIGDRGFWVNEFSREGKKVRLFVIEPSDETLFGVFNYAK